MSYHHLDSLPIHYIVPDHQHTPGQVISIIYPPLQFTPTLPNPIFTHFNTLSVCEKPSINTIINSKPFKY